MKKVEEPKLAPAGRFDRLRRILRTPISMPFGWPRRSWGARPGILLLLAWLGIGLFVLLDPSGPGGAPDGQIHLLDGRAIPNLNSTSAKRRLPSGTEPVVLAQHHVAQPPELTIEPAAPNLLAPPVVESGYHYANTHRGDSPMLSNWKALAVPLILAGAITAPELAAQEPAVKPTDLADIKKQIEEINKKLLGIDQLRQSLLSMDKDMQEEIKSRREHAAGVNTKLEQSQADVSLLKNQVEQLRRDFDALRVHPATQQVSAYSPVTAGIGHVRLTNTYFEPVRIVVNGRSYDVAPGEAKLAEPVPAGTFSYEVLGVQPPVSRTLAANETFVVTVHP